MQPITHHGPVGKKSSPKKPAKPTCHSPITLIILSSVAVITTLALATYNASDISCVYDASASSATRNLLGSFGAYWAALLLYFFGFSAWFIPIILFYAVRIMLFNLTWKRELDRLLALPIFALASTSIMYMYAIELYRAVSPGGLCGRGLHGLLAHFFSPPHTELFLFTLTWGLGIIIARFSSASYLYPVAELLNKLPVNKLINAFTLQLSRLVNTLTSALRALTSNNESENDPLNALTTETLTAVEHEENKPYASDILAATTIDASSALAEDRAWSPESSPEVLPAREDQYVQLGLDEQRSTHAPYCLPPLTLFPVQKDYGTDTASHTDGQQRAQTLEHKLERFGIKGKVVKITHGPAVMLFEYQPSIDTKISTILAREDDLALALQALSLRIIAPIPGRSVIGFEVAHNKRKPVLFSQQLQSPAWTGGSAQLPLILGKDTLGMDVVIDLATMPHLLVAGSTGSGKSVGLHTMVMSLLCSKSPEEVKFILIDPKRLEFAAYADIPHLLFPIVTDPRRAIAALKWAVEAMEDRYALMAQAAVRNCSEYNSKFTPGDEEYLPLIVIIIDELADLMMTAGKDVEHSIARLAQMARAAGIHIITATQRPSVDVITGLIKVNFPSRIAYKVTSKVDSRTILDTMGAEKLLGKGDMLFLDSKGAIHRVHGAYVTDAEIQSVVQHVKAQRTVAYQELISFKNEAAAEDGDELFQEVINYIKNKDEISISLVQRVFRIGYNRSARIMDQLESYGYILPADGSKMRKVSKET